MSTQKQADWILDFSLRVAVIICLSTLALGIVSGADPLMALMRSGIAFISFLTLGWAVSLLWNVPKAQQAEVPAENDDAENQADTTAPQTATAVQPALSGDN